MSTLPIGAFPERFVQNSAYNVSVSIQFLGDADLDAFCSWNGTDGTAGNPHYISGFSIDGTGTSFCIELFNITRHLVIEGNLLGNASSQSDFTRAGLNVINSSNVLVRGNVIRDNSVGVMVQSSTNVTLHDNLVLDCWFMGVGINDSMHVGAWNNSFRGCGFMVYGSIEQCLSIDLATSNRINTNGTMVYIKNAVGTLGVPVHDGDQVFLVNCSDVAITGMRFERSTVGINLLHSSRINVNNNTFTNQTLGISVMACTSSIISGNVLDSNVLWNVAVVLSSNISIASNHLRGALYSLSVANSEFTSIIDNRIEENIWDGTVVYGSYHTEIRGNRFLNNPQFNVKIVESFHARILDNEIEGGERGVGLAWDNHNMTVSRNVINCSSNDVQVHSSTMIVVSSNTLADGGLNFQSYSDARVYLNNFLGPNPPVYSEASCNVSWDWAGWGNYWNDYTSLFPDAQAASNGTWLQPYNITVFGLDIVDHRPLVDPNLVPRVSLVSNTTRWVTGKPVSFELAGCPGDAPLQVTWDFGDGIASTMSTSVGHAFTLAGTYGVSVEVLDRHDEVAVASRNEWITIEPNLLVIASIHANQTRLAPGAHVAIMYNGSEGNGDVTVAWELNGVVINSSSPVIRLSFDGPGVHVIKVIVIDFDGDVGVATLVLEVISPGQNDPFVIAVALLLAGCLATVIAVPAVARLRHRHLRASGSRD